MKAKSTYPSARDAKFAEGLLLRGFRFLINEPQDGLGKSAIDLFDISYKLGLPIRPTLIQALGEILSHKREAETYSPKVTHKYIFKRWGKIPLPWISHRERYEDGILESRIYQDGRGVRVEAVKENILLGPHEGELMRDPSMGNLWRFLISVYASRKLAVLYEDYETGRYPLALHKATANTISEEIRDINPVGIHGRTLKKMDFESSQKRLAELFIVLEKRRWIPAVVSGAIQRAFNNTASIPDLLKPGLTSRSNKRHYSKVYTAEYTGIFDCIPENPERF